MILPNWIASDDNTLPFQLNTVDIRGHAAALTGWCWQQAGSFATRVLNLARKNGIKEVD